MNQQVMKKVGRQMSLLMSVTLSFFLSLTGTLHSGQFTVPAWLTSFVLSLIVSLLIGFFVPMKKVTEGACRKLNLQPGKLGTRCFESLLSDLIYTPAITFLMVLFAWRQAVSHGAPVKFWPMFLPSLALSMAVGFVLIFLCMPVFMKFVLKRNGVEPRK